MPFHDTESRSVKELTAGVRARNLWSDNVMLALGDLDDNAVFPLHNHPHEQG